MCIYLCVKNIVPVTPPHLFPRLRNCWEDPAVTQGQCARCCAQIIPGEEAEKESACAPLLPFPIPHIYILLLWTLLCSGRPPSTYSQSVPCVIFSKCASWFSSNLGNVRPWTLSLASLSPPSLNPHRSLLIFFLYHMWDCVSVCLCMCECVWLEKERDFGVCNTV